MSRLRRAAAVAIAACVALASAAALSVPASSATDPSTVIVLLAPYLTWQDIDGGQTPALARLAEEGALANVAVRAGIRPGQVPDDLRGAAVLSAGQHVAAPTAAQMLAPASPYGQLGGAVAEAGGTTAAIGTGARSLDEAGEPASSAAYITAMDTGGQVDLARIDEQVLRESPTAPLGVTADLSAFERFLRSVPESDAQDADVPRLVVLDPGDGARAREAAEQGGSWDRLRTAAVATTDDVAAIALQHLPSDGVLLVVSTAEYASGGVEGFGPLLIYGRGSGVLYSPGTRLQGIVGLPDVSATTLSLLDVEIPEGMAGSPLEQREPPANDETPLEYVQRIDTTARAFDAPRMPVWYGFIGLCLVVLLLALVALVWPRLRAFRRFRRVLAVVLLVCLSAPLGTYIAQMPGHPETVSNAWLQLAVGTGLAAAAVLILAWRRGFVVALGAIAGTTTLAIAVDQLAGAPLAYGGIFSYSPLFGTRYYGLGNEGAAVLVAAALVAAVLLADSRPIARSWAILAVGAGVVMVAVAPFAGANIGVAAWGTAGFLTCWAYRERRRVTWRSVVAGVLVIAAIVVLAVLLDSMADTQSHLGAAVDSLLNGSGVRELLKRKVALNLDVLRATPLVLLLPALVGLLTYALVRPRGWVVSFISNRRGLAAALVGTLAAAAVGAVTEDSGVSVSALLLLYGLGGPLVVALSDEAEVTG